MDGIRFPCAITDAMRSEDAKGEGESTSIYQFFVIYSLHNHVTRSSATFSEQMIQKAIDKAYVKIQSVTDLSFLQLCIVNQNESKFATIETKHNNVQIII
jgi:hypothetical protein